VLDNGVLKEGIV